jgi:hypothetical protein
MPAKRTASDSDITVGEFLTLLLPRLESDHKVPVWPPDVFALCCSLLLKSGAYCETLTDWPPREPFGKSAGKWASRIETLGKEWRRSSKQQVPSAVQQWWNVLVENWHVTIHSIETSKKPVPIASSDVCRSRRSVRRSRKYAAL